MNNRYDVYSARRVNRYFGHLNLLKSFKRYADAYRYMRENAPTAAKGCWLVLDQYRDNDHVGRWVMNEWRYEETIFICSKS